MLCYNNLKKKSSLKGEEHDPDPDDDDDDDDDDDSDDEDEGRGRPTTRSTGSRSRHTARSASPSLRVRNPYPVRATRNEHPDYNVLQATKLAEHIDRCLMCDTSFMEDTLNSFAFLQSYSLKAGLKKFGQKGYDSAMKEIGQLHGRGAVKPVHLRDLTDIEGARALEAVTRMLEKKSGECKTRVCADGSVQKDWMSKEDITSPTAHTDSIFLTAVADAFEDRYVVTSDLPNAFIQAHIKPPKGGPRVTMVLRGLLAEMMVKLAPEVYSKYLFYEKGKAVLYLIVTRAIYGMVESPMLWFQKLSNDLKSQGFEPNPYDPCVVNKKVNGTNLTVVWHVDDLKISHKDEKVVEDLLVWLDKKYSDANGKVTVTRGDKHVYLGMTLDYSEKGSSQDQHGRLRCGYVEGVRRGREARSSRTVSME